MQHFDPDLNIKRIILVGCGGTGSEVARLVARILYDMKRNHLQTPDFLLIDDDVVSDENIGRQLYSPADAGIHKSRILATRFNAALGLDIEYKTERFNPKHPHHQHYGGSLLIGAVDNHKARRALASVPNACWIDAGNHYTSGQVVIGNTRNRDQVIAALNRPTENQGFRYVPNAALVFPELLLPEPKQEAPQQLSCADLVARGQQHLLVNNMVASVVAQYVYRLLHRQPITAFCTFILTDPPSMKSRLVTREDIEQSMSHRTDVADDLDPPGPSRRLRFTGEIIHTDETDPVLRELLLN